MRRIAKTGFLLSLLILLFHSLSAQDKEILVGKWVFDSFVLTDSTEQQYRSGEALILLQEL